MLSLRKVNCKVRIKTGIRVIGIVVLFLLFSYSISQTVFASYHTERQRKEQQPAPIPVVINEVMFLPKSEEQEQLIEIANLGKSRVRLLNWYLCNRSDCWKFSKGTTIGPGKFLVVHVGVSGNNTETDLFITDFVRLNTKADELSLYSSNKFKSSRALVDFVQWGPAVQGPTRLSVAIWAKQWRPGEFVDVSALRPGQSIRYLGSGDNANGWTVRSATIGDQN